MNVLVPLDRRHMPSARERDLKYTERPASDDTCNGTLVFDDRALGLNNQLLSLGFMLCLARTFRPCALVGPPIGYAPCGLHNPGVPHGRSKPCTSSAFKTSLVPARAVVKLSPMDRTVLERGEALNNSKGLKCSRAQALANPDDCKECGPYNQRPYHCVDDNLRAGRRVYVLYPYGLTRKLGRPDTPPCMGGTRPAH